MSAASKGRRSVQHLADPRAIAKAKRDGTKVKADCGALIYPMTEMKDEIPTCTPCVTSLRKLLERVQTTTGSGTYTFTWTNGGTWVS